jgi:hypothetical protein
VEVFVMRVRVLAACLALIVLGLPGPAGAQTVTCDQLQAALDGSDEGDVITLVETQCIGNFTLPSHEIMLESHAPGGTTISAPTAGPPILSGTDIGTTTIRNLTFEGGDSSDTGGAIQVTGASAPSIIGNTFLGNSAAGNGGAVSILPSKDPGIFPIVIKDNTFGGNEVGDGNDSGASGGALYLTALGRVEITGNTFRGNTARFGGGASIDVGDSSVIGELLVRNNSFRDNVAESNGGGLGISVGNGNVEITGNSLTENELTGASFLTEATFARGAGLHLALAHQDTRVKQLNNLFRENRTGLVTGGSSGAGEHVQVVVTPELFRSTNDRFLANAVAHEGGRGGGLAFAGSTGASLRLRNTVVMGNSVGSNGSGSGISVDCDGCLFSAALDNATIINNTGSAAEPGDQISGSSSSVLLLDNSIVYAADLVITGFAAMEIAFSDVCVDGSAAPGDGNFCAAPRLKGLLDFHQTSQSPTIDSGRNALRPKPLKKDPDGDKRKLDGDGDGTATIDVGADERKP